MTARAQYQPWLWGARCAECPLFHAGKTPVPPTGPQDADLVYVGEGPAKWEEIKGAAMQGPSGQKLNELLWKIGRRRESVFVTNAMMCRCEVPGEQGARRYEVKSYMAWHRRQNALRKREGLQQVPSPLECCRPRLEAELKMLEAAAQARGAPNGVVVQPLGNFAETQLKDILGDRIEGKMGSILKMRGSVLEVKP